MALFLVAISGLIMITSSSTIICANPSCDFGICNSDECNYNVYICSSSTNICSIQCESGCINVTITSSAQETEVLCTHPQSCHGLTIEISQNDTQSSSNSLLLSCAQSSSCSNMNIACNKPHLCQCEDSDDIQCKNNVYGQYTNTDSDTTTTKEPEKSSTAVVLIILVIIFWILVCLVVPVCFVKKFRDNLLHKHNASEKATKESKHIAKQSASETVPENSKTQSKDVKTINDDEDPTKTRKKRTPSTHRRALSNSMMARMKHLNVNAINDELKETDVNCAEAMIPYIETREDGELAIPANINAAQVEQNRNERNALKPAEEPLVLGVSPSMNEGGDNSYSDEIEGSDSNDAEIDRFSDES